MLHSGYWVKPIFILTKESQLNPFKKPLSNCLSNFTSCLKGISSTTNLGECCSFKTYILLKDLGNIMSFGELLGQDFFLFSPSIKALEILQVEILSRFGLFLCYMSYFLPNLLIIKTLSIRCDFKKALRFRDKLCLHGRSMYHSSTDQHLYSTEDRKMFRLAQHKKVEKSLKVKMVPVRMVLKDHRWWKVPKQAQFCSHCLGKPQPGENISDKLPVSLQR